MNSQGLIHRMLTEEDRPREGTESPVIPGRPPRAQAVWRAGEAAGRTQRKPQRGQLSWDTKGNLAVTVRAVWKLNRLRLEEIRIGNVY